MTTKDKIEYLASLCKEDVSIWINNYYRGAGETIRSYLSERNDDVPEDDIKEMEKRNLIVEVQAYPLSQVGFYNVAHYDLDIALDRVIECVKSDLKL